MGASELTSALAGISADLPGLRALAGQLRAEVTDGLQPRTQDSVTPMAAGSVFAQANPSADADAVRRKYADSLVATIDQMVDHLDTSARLVDALNWIVDKYGAADALAGATIADVQAAFAAADHADRLRRFGGGANPNGGL